MKKLFITLLALLCCAGGCFAEMEPLFGGSSVIDLDGDGVTEELEWSYSFRSGESFQHTVIHINGLPLWQDPLYDANIIVLDMDGDGKMELILSGIAPVKTLWTYRKEMRTYCLHYEDGAFVPLAFDGAGYGVGWRSVIEGELFKLMAEFDMYEKYFGDTVYRLENGTFVRADEWLLHFDDISKEDRWEIFALTPNIDIPATFIVDGVETSGTLMSGERFIVTASDSTGRGWFILEDGREGLLDASDPTAFDRNRLEY